MNANSDHILSLMYHDVVESGDLASSGFSGGDADRYKLEAKAFSRQLAIIQDCGMRAGTIEQALSEPLLSLVLTFDDGGVGALDAADCMEKFGYIGYFFVTTQRIGQSRFLSSSQMRDLSNRGHVIGSHSASHPQRMASLPADTISAEWQQSLDTLQDSLGSSVDVASVPGGYYSPQLGELAFKCGIQTLFTSEPERRVHKSNGLTTLGRYTVLNSTGDDGIKSLVTGSRFSRQKQYLNWNARKMLKRAAGPWYDTVRRRILSR
ncbi:MAG: polysaccharide deacetylase family protein [Lysobacterales bacterium]